jgi:hypothetical protein
VAVSFASLLTHTVHIERDGDTGTLDDYGHPVTALEVGEDFRADLQPRSGAEMAREVPLMSQGGVAMADWRIYMLPRTVSNADKIVHDSSACGVPEERDLPDATYEIVAVRNAAGRGHHLVIDARLVGHAIEGVAGS